MILGIQLKMNDGKILCIDPEDYIDIYGAENTFVSAKDIKSIETYVAPDEDVIEANADN